MSRCLPMVWGVAIRVVGVGCRVRVWSVGKGLWHGVGCKGHTHTHTHTHTGAATGPGVDSKVGQQVHCGAGAIQCAKRAACCRHA